MAQASYPNKSMKMIVPFPPGGGTDTVARALAQRLSAALGHAVIVDNKAGAGTTIGLAELARAAPDGYTMGIGGNSDPLLPLLLASTFLLAACGQQDAAPAADAAPDLVARQKAEADRTATRRDTALQGEIAALQSRQSEGATVLARTLANLDLYAEQYSLGRRSLTDLVGQYAAAARLERDQAALGFAIARLQLERARDMGTLIAGSRL